MRWYCDSLICEWVASRQHFRTKTCGCNKLMLKVKSQRDFKSHFRHHVLRIWNSFLNFFSHHSFANYHHHHFFLIKYMYIFIILMQLPHFEKKKKKNQSPVWDEKRHIDISCVFQKLHRRRRRKCMNEKKC